MELSCCEDDKRAFVHRRGMLMKRRVIWLVVACVVLAATMFCYVFFDDLFISGNRFAPSDF